MKILFLTEGRTVPASRFRVEQYISYLEKEGIKCSVSACWPDKYYLPRWHKKKIIGWWIIRLFFVLKIINRFFAVLRAPFYDIVFLQRDLLPLDSFPILELLLRKISKRVIFDFDDAIYLHMPKKIPKIIKKSDCVIAGNKNLSDFAEKYSSNVKIIPSSVDTNIYLPCKKENSEIVIGWMGSSSGMLNLNIISEVLKKLSKEKHFILRIVSDTIVNLTFFKDIKMDFRKWSAKRELDDLRSFDIGIMPLIDNEINRGKCGFKVLLYMSCAIPAIASPVGVNKEIIQDGINGFLANSEEEWVEKLSRLIEDKKLREKLGREGRKTVEEKYSIKANLPKLIEVFQI